MKGFIKLAFANVIKKNVIKQSQNLAAFNKIASKKNLFIYFNEL
jgi:hypothetical protein